MKVIIENGCGEIIEKKSRFIAHVYNIENEEMALTYIEDIKKKYWDARHNCYAYVCGDIVKFSDDGEPGSTAGKPILEVIKGENITNCLIVVTRYFGGVLLGTGGLVRAYTQSAKEGLDNAIVIEKIPGIEYTFDVDYTLVGKIQYASAKGDFYIKDITYENLVRITAIVKKENENSFEKYISELSGGKIMLDNKNSIYFGENQGKIATFYTKE